MNRSWTEEETNIIKKYFPLIPTKLSIEELVQILNRSAASIHQKAYSLGLKMQSVDMIDRDLLKKLVERVEI